MTQTFSPEQQALYEKQTKVKGLLGDLGISGAHGLGDIIGKNLDLSGAPAAPGNYDATRQQVINAMMGRVDEDVGKSRDQANSDLVAAGIHPGTKAYDDAQFQITRGRNDALQQAQIAAGNTATQAAATDAQRRKDAIAEILAQRQTPLNEVSALQSGSQVSNPFAGGLGYQAGAQMTPTPVYQSTKDQYQGALDAYGIQSGASGGMLGGLFSLGSAYLGSPNGPSDRRLKRKVLRVGTHRIGIPLYTWEYVWGEAGLGVMADELEAVMPAAVTRRGGYQVVNYAMIGGRT